MKLLDSPCRLLLLGVWLGWTLGGAAQAQAPPAGAAAPAIATPDALAEVDEAFRRELRRTIGVARDRVFPALVSIDVVTVVHHGGKEIKGQSTGSGTLFSAEGHVLTNAHVTVGGRKFNCTLSDQRKVPARLVGEDPLTDLAVLQVDIEALGPGASLPFAAFGDSDALEIGDYVMAMGSPFSLSRSVSLGIVSNTERVFPGGFGAQGDDLELEQGQRTGLFTRWIQHDALISPGNSGGPLVDLEGQVVGVNELGSGNISFAIPSNLAARIGAELIRHGRVERSWIGLGFLPLGSDLEARQGARIAAVEVESPGARAGLRPGDLLEAIDGVPVVGRVPEDMPPLLDLVASRPVGSRLRLNVRRGDRVLEVLVETARMEKDVGEETSFHAWGLTAQEITPKMMRDLRLPDTRGALVTGVRRGGPAQLAEPPLEQGDVVRRVGERPIEQLAELVELYRASTRPSAAPAAAAAAPAVKPPLLFGFTRRGTDQLTLLQPRIDDQEEPPRELPKAWIGVASQPVLPLLAESLGLGEERGFRITRVYAGSEAEKAGLRVGDILLRVDGEPLEANALEDGALLARRVRARSIGDRVSLTVRRGERTFEQPLVLERTRLTPEEARRATDHDFELSVRELTFFDRDERNWPADAEGVMVENVDGAGWAGLGGLRPDDLILSIAGQPVASLAAFRRILREQERARPEKVPVNIRRGSRLIALELEPDWTPEAGRAAGARR